MWNFGSSIPRSEINCWKYYINKIKEIQKQVVWVAHELPENNLMYQIFIFKSLINRNKFDHLWRRWYHHRESLTTTLSEKGRGRTAAKPGLTIETILFCVWWDWQKIICYELLFNGQTLNSNLYCQYLNRPNGSNRPQSPALANERRITFYPDNSRTHTLTR